MWCMPGPRRAMKRATVLSSWSAATSSTRPEPSTRGAASTRWPVIVPRPSSRPPKHRAYVSTASSRSSTAIPTWWMARACTPAMLPPVGLGREHPNGADGLARVRLGRHVAEQREQLLALERLPLEQGRGDAVEGGPVLAQQADGLLVGGVGEPGLLQVAEPLGLLRKGVVVGAHGARGDRLAHPVLEDHLARERSDALQVVGGAVGDPPEHDELGRAAREHDLHQIDQLLARVQVAILA